MSELRDHELRSALWDASGEDCDTGDALLRVEARVRRIRRRRMDVIGVGLLAAIVVTLGVASRSEGRSSPDRPAPAATVATATTAATPPVSAPSAPIASSAAPPTPPATTASGAESPTPNVDAASPDAASAETATEATPGAADQSPEPAPAAGSASSVSAGAAPSQRTVTAHDGDGRDGRVGEDRRRPDTTTSTTTPRADDGDSDARPAGDYPSRRSSRYGRDRNARDGSYRR